MNIIFVLLSALGAVAGGLKCQSSLEEGIKWNINCSGMNLSAAPPPMIFHPVKLLNLSHNVFIHVKESQFVNWTDITLLDLSFNSITAIDIQAFKGLSNLTELNLMNNKLDILSLNITNYLPKIRILNLSSNKLKYIDADAFNSATLLLKLYLRDNVGLGSTFANYNPLSISLGQSLITLDLANISLRVISDNFFNNATHLISLSIAQNPLKRISNVPPSLRNLNISGTLLETVPQGLFLNNDALQRLSLEYMPLLKDIKASAFSGLSNLEELYIRDCPKLSFISGDAFGVSQPKLHKLIIVHCALTTLPKTFKLLLSKVVHLDLQDNPWACDGRIGWIVRVNIQSNLTTNLRCDSPPTAQGMLMVDFFKPRSLHPFSSLIRAGIVIALVIILVASVIGMIRHTRKEKAKTYRQLQTITLQDRSPRTLPSL